jgi:hypothetical protein
MPFIGSKATCYSLARCPPHVVIAGRVPATPIIMARECPVIGVAGTSPAMTEERGSVA